jgi:hypothetical protein
MALEREVVEKARELDAMRKRNRDQQSYIFTLSNRLSAAQTECYEVQKSKEAATADRDDPARQQKIRYDYSVMRDEVLKVRRQQDQLRIVRVDASSLGPSQKAILEQLDLIRVGIMDAFSSFDVATIPANAGHGHEILESWAQRLAGCSFSQVLSSATESSISEPELLRSLAAIGLCCLAFESSFHCFMELESPLLDQYRQHVRTRGNKIILYASVFLWILTLISIP